MLPVHNFQRSAFSSPSGFIRWILASSLILLSAQSASATNHLVRINEIMGGLNGHSGVQFVEIVSDGDGQKNWGPQGFGGVDNILGRAMLTFFDPAGTQTGRFVFQSDPGPLANTVLIATQKFADLTGITPDFIMPPGVMPIAGKVCFKNNPENSFTFFINLCLSYGGAGFTGDTEGAGAANGAELAILNSQSLSRNANFFAQANANSSFALATPTPNSTLNDPAGTNEERNVVGEVVLPGAASQVAQGENLFTKETFQGNGRTCAACHKEVDDFNLTPNRLATLPLTDLLFMNEINVNTLVVNSAGSIHPTGTTGSQPSDFFLGDTLTGSLGGLATVLAGTGTTYRILDGASLNIAGNVISDSHSNIGTVVSFTDGNLDGPTPTNGEARGIEDTMFLTGGRALITENINGFTENSFMRMSPNLLNLTHTAPYGMSGEFADLQAFSSEAVMQHFPRTLNRVAGTDFRTPTTAELAAMAAFQDSLFLPADQDFDEANNFNKFVTTDAQMRGRDLFFGTAKCSICHDGKVLATSDGTNGTRLGINESFNTGVSTLPINTTDGLPTEQAMGQAANSRAFSTRPLFGLKNTAPFFHDGSAETLLDAILFYDALQFRLSPAAAQVGAIEVLNMANALDIQAFLTGLFGCSTLTAALDLTDEGAITDEKTEKACNSITAGGNYTIEAGGSRALKAVTITLTPGFTVKTGGQFIAKGGVP